MSLDVGEHGAKEIESVIDTRFSLLVMRHWVLPVHRPEADLRVNLERPLLALWQPYNLHPRF